MNAHLANYRPEPIEVKYTKPMSDRTMGLIALIGFAVCALAVLL